MQIQPGYKADLGSSKKSLTKGALALAPHSLFQVSILILRKVAICNNFQKKLSYCHNLFFSNPLSL